MKKIISAIFMAAACLFSLSACSSNDPVEYDDYVSSEADFNLTLSGEILKYINVYVETQDFGQSQTTRTQVTKSSHSTSLTMKASQAPASCSYAVKFEPKSDLEYPVKISEFSVALDVTTMSLTNNNTVIPNSHMTDKLSSSDTGYEFDNQESLKKYLAADEFILSTSVSFSKDGTLAKEDK